MSSIQFQAIIGLKQVVAGTLPDTWAITLTFADKGGVVTPLDIQAGDIIVLDTSPFSVGTIGFMKILEVSNPDFSTPTVIAEFIDTFGGILPNLDWLVGSQGLISRPTGSLNLLPVVSSDIQLTNNYLPVQVMNYNLTLLGDSSGLIEDKTINGAVFITDINPVDPNDNIGNKTYSEDGTQLLLAETTTKAIIVTVMAISGHSSFKPKVTVNGLTIGLSNIVGSSMFSGTIEVLLDDTLALEAVHSDGPISKVGLTLDAKPIIETSSFFGNYPNGQTELKEGDVMSLLMVSDLDVVKYELADYGAFKPIVGDMVSPTNNVVIPNLKIADRGNTTTSQGFKIRVAKANGTWSDWYTTDLISPVELVGVVKLNNIKPTVTISNIIYPLSQGAVKGLETVTIDNLVSDADEVRYLSTELDIPNPLTFENTKVLTPITNGSPLLSIGNQNCTIRATKLSNGSETVLGFSVNIVNIEPTININLPRSRLRSGGSFDSVPQLHSVEIESNQPLLESPSLEAVVAPWQTPSFSSTDGLSWRRNLVVDDNVEKGTFNWSNLLVTGLSGITNTTINIGSTFTIGGFVRRTMQVPAFPNREADIGTKVIDVLKLRCTNLSKGATGSLNYTYAPNKTEDLDKYTILDSLGNVGLGNTWYNNDGLNASSNTSGEMFIELEEVV